jgi:hypothetical protein
MSEQLATPSACRARTGNDRAPELSGIVSTTGALDISSGVDSHENHMRPAQPLGHSTHCMLASGDDGYDRALELSETVEAAGALDINGRAASNATSLWSRGRNGRAPELSSTVDAVGALDLKAVWRATAATCDQPGLSGTPPTARQLQVATVTWESWFDRSGENACPTNARHANNEGRSRHRRSKPHRPGHPMRRFCPAAVAASQPHRSFISRHG